MTFSYMIAKLILFVWDRIWANIWKQMCGLFLNLIRFCFICANVFYSFSLNWVIVHDTWMASPG